ncbi:NAD(P)-dependent oxidoreductase [Streptomyces cyaneofuscatus]|uniref:NAD(P)-dependent oxidoreductase n=1 Tax=Streptomyces cyaneofuscatus TaxID=66883 RepID=UPI003802F201
MSVTTAATHGQAQPRVAVLPGPAPAEITAALRSAGAVRTPPEQAEALVWMGEDPARLAEALRAHPSPRWVQLASAGVDGYLPMTRDGRTWTRACDVYGRPVAEHALLLVMACLRDAMASTRAASWRPGPAVALAGLPVVIVGGGSVGTALVRLLAVCRARVTVVRRGAGAVPGASVVTGDRLDDVLPRARVVVLAAPLTDATRGLIDARRLRAMREDACLVNVGRGPLVVTADLVRALAEGWIASAGLDVTDPEPLPDGHPLWRLPNCLITAHSAGDVAGTTGPFGELVADNTLRWADGRPLRGLIRPDLGY